MAAVFRFPRFISRSSVVCKVDCRRKIGMAAVLLSDKSSDPIQKLFAEKLKDYKKKSSSTGGGLVDMTPEMKTKIDGEMLQIRKRFGEGNLEEFPKFEFTKN